MSDTILIAIEDSYQRALIVKILVHEGYQIIEAESGTRTLSLLKRQPDIALILADLNLSDIRKQDFVARLHTINAHIPIIVLVQSEEDPRLAAALQSGADDFLLVPPSPLRLKLSVETILRHHNLERESHRVRRYAENHLKFKDLVAKSPKMRDCITTAKQYIRRDVNILLSGEEGCEHELFARILHRENTVRHGAFARIQCLDLEHNDAQQHWQDELATKLAKVHHGSLLLANIDRLNKQSQRHILDTIQHKRMGSDADIRFMATTTVDLGPLAVQGQFHVDLLSIFADAHITIAPLRERRQDIETLALVILKVVVAETGRSQIGGIGESAKVLLREHDWPGNLAELENALFRAVLLGEGPMLSVSDFPQIWRRRRLRALAGHINLEHQDLAQGNQSLLDEFGHIRSLVEIEKLAINAALQRYEGVLSEVARRLGLSRATLYRKMENYQITLKTDRMR